MSYAIESMKQSAIIHFSLFIWCLLIWLKSPSMEIANDVLKTNQSQ